MADAEAEADAEAVAVAEVEAVAGGVSSVGRQRWQRYSLGKPGAAGRAKVTVNLRSRKQRSKRGSGAVR